MGFFTMPILAWSLYLVGYVLIVSGLLLAVILLYLLAARIIQTGVFGAQADPRLWQNYFWFAMRPAALFALLPAAGVISEVVAGVSRKGIAGYRMVVGSLISLMGLGFVTWGIQLGGLGQDPGTTLAFSGLGAMAVVPVALIAYAWLATLQGGAIADTPLDIFVLGFFLHAGIAALMELLLISPALGAYLGNSMFASTRLDYLIWGGALGSLLAGLHYWWPLMTGAMYSPGAARVGGSFYVLGLNLALIPRMMMGTRGVAQDMMAFEPGPTALSELSALGWLVMFCGLAVILANLYASSWRRERAGDNPWGVSALEWTAGSPPPSDNFETAPVAGRPYSS
jgi:cytochrome c oxidase subunit 1